MFEKPYWWWGSEPPRVRAGWKHAAQIAGLALTACSWLTHRTATEWALVCILGPVAGVGLVMCFRRVEEWQHWRTKIMPLAWALVPVLDQPAAGARSWLHVPEDYASNPEAEVTIDVPREFTGADRELDDVTRAVTAKLGFPNPQVTARLGGRAPCLVFKHAISPPDKVSLPDIRPRIEAAKPSVVVLGLAAKSVPVEVDLDSDTPHLGVSIKTGGGKSEFLKNIAAQVLYHGGIVMILDYKLTSHMWADQLPNVSYARTPQEIQRALMWLAWDEYDDDGNIIRRSELTRRKEVVLAARRARETPNPGPRLLVLAEEKNATTRALKRYHRRTGGKGGSPALESIDETGETGRFIRTNVMHAAQRLSAKASGSDGSRDAFENICGVVTKDPDEQTWKLVGRGHAQPPKSGHKGRYQWVTDAGVTEFQGALYDADPDRSDDIASSLAMSGEVGQVPHDMPFVWRGGLLVPAGVGQVGLARQEGSDQGFVSTQPAPVLTVGEGPGRAVTCAQMAAAGLFVTKAAAAKVAQRQGWTPVGGDRYTTGYTYAVTDIYEYLQAKGKR